MYANPKFIKKLFSFTPKTAEINNTLKKSEEKINSLIPPFEIKYIVIIHEKSLKKSPKANNAKSLPDDINSELYNNSII